MLKLGFGRFFLEAYNQFWNFLLQKNTQVWANKVLMIRELQASRSTRDALTLKQCIEFMPFSIDLFNNWKRTKTLKNILDQWGGVL
jgi:hypothetical protein